MQPEPNPEIDLLIAEIAELRPLPVVAARVLQITEGDKFSAHELSQTIAADQALTAKVLRLANSAYYGFPRRITTVRDAVVLLGFRAVRSSTITSCVIETVPGGNVIDPQTAWRYSMTVGLLAEVLARAERRHIDEAFTAGILHNIGRLALDQRRPEQLLQARNLATSRGISIREAQLEVLGFTDNEFGEALALHWNFPPTLAEAVAHQHLDVDHLPDPRSLAAHVIRARIFARAARIDDGYDVAQSAPPRRAANTWEEPPVKRALAQAGGIDGILERVNAFLASTDLGSARRR